MATLMQNTLEIKKRDNSVKPAKNVFSHFVEYGHPVLSDISDSLPSPDRWDEVTIAHGTETGLIKTPVYENKELNFLQDCLTVKCQGIVRGRESNDIPQELKDYTESGGGIKYLSILKDTRILFTRFLEQALADKSEAVRSQIVNYLKPEVIIAAEQERVDRFFKIWGVFESKLSDEQVAIVSIVSRKLEEAWIAKSELNSDSEENSW